MEGNCLLYVLWLSTGLFSRPLLDIQMYLFSLSHFWCHIKSSNDLYEMVLWRKTNSKSFLFPFGTAATNCKNVASEENQSLPQHQGILSDIHMKDFTRGCRPHAGEPINFEIHISHTRSVFFFFLFFSLHWLTSCNHAQVLKRRGWFVL